ncbi:MAG TPA: thermonuclease family protein [Geminicoccaceae bacterium]|nr:thermonuclease family protein [Geminicoccaceae bacterium]
MRSTWLLAALLVLGAAVPPASADLASHAIVRGDASLQIRGETVRLYGLYVPPTGRTCRTDVGPVRCASRAALALDGKVRGLVRCEVQGRYADGSLGAFCFVDGRSVLAPDVDLGAWLIQQGWAVAAPEAPFEYAVLEEIARTQRRGVWGFQVDAPSGRSVRPRGWHHRRP